MPAADLPDQFLAEQKRSVQKDRTVTLDGVAFEVDASLVGERVTLRSRRRPRPLLRQAQRTKNLEINKGPGAEPPEGLSLRVLIDPDDEEDIF